MNNTNTVMPNQVNAFELPCSAFLEYNDIAPQNFSNEQLWRR